MDNEVKEWDSMSNMPRDRKNFVFLSPGDGFAYAIGGQTGSAGATNRIDRYNIATNTWTSSYVSHTCQIN